MRFTKTERFSWFAEERSYGNACLEAHDDSSDDSDEELEGVVDTSSSDSEASTAPMDSRHAALRARHKGKATTAEKGKGKAMETSPDPTLAARLPPTGIVIGASPIATALAAAHHPRLRKRNSNSSTQPLLRKQSIPETSPPRMPAPWTRPSSFVQFFQAGLNNVIQGLIKDSKPLKSAKATHSKEWFKGEVEKQYLLDLGEADYDMGYHDAQKEMFNLLKARDATFSQTGWGLLDPATPDDTQGAESVALNTSVDTHGDIPMESAYLESAANVDSVTAMDRAAVPTLTEVG
nr:MAP7 domain-containing protein 1-like [Ipomoea batatas]